MSPHPGGRVVEDRAYLQIDCLDRTEGALDLCQALVGGDRGIGVERLPGEAGADDVQAVERRLGVDAALLALPAEAGVGDREFEVLGHVVVIRATPRPQGDRLRPAQRVALTRHGCGNRRQLGLGRRQQLGPLAGALFGQQGVAAHDQALARKVFAVQFQQIALIKQRGLEGAVLLRQQGDLGRPQAADPVHPMGFEHSLDAGRGDHAAIAHPGDVLDAETLLELGHLCRHRGRIGRIAGEHLDRHRATAGRADQAKDDLWIVASPIARMAACGKRTAATREPGRRQVVENERATRQVLACQTSFDGRLRVVQPVQRPIKRLGLDRTQTQHPAQRMRRRVVVQLAVGSQL